MLFIFNSLSNTAIDFGFERCWGSNSTKRHIVKVNGEDCFANLNTLRNGEVLQRLKNVRTAVDLQDTGYSRHGFGKVTECI